MVLSLAAVIDIMSVGKAVRTMFHHGHIDYKTVFWAD
jgi:hypothetical protein